MLAKVTGVAALAWAITLGAGGPQPAHAVNPIMHNSSTTSLKYGSWGKTFTCATCHTAGAPGGNAKGVRSNINGYPVVFGSYSSFGKDTAHTTSNRVCEVCHTQTGHHRYNNPATNHNGNGDCVTCHLHSNGFSAGGESPGGTDCSGCHNDLYLNASGYGMHSNVGGVSYKHYLDNAATTGDASLTGQQVGTSFYATNVPDSTTVAPKARRCLMCHVDHDQFKSNRAFNLRPNVTAAPTSGMNSDDSLCLSCHDTEKTKAVVGPNGETRTMPIPFPNLAYANATSILKQSTHGYSVSTTYADGTQFNAICVKCHNDSIGRNGEGNKSSYGAQKGTYKFGEHNSTLPARFAIFSNDFYQRPSTGTTLTLDSVAKTIQVVPSPNWTTDIHDGHYLVITQGGGANSRAVVAGNSSDTLTLTSWPAGLDGTSMFDVTDDNLALENVCFSCHSKNGEEKSNGSNTDWYGATEMSTGLEGIYDIFVGDSGRLNASVNRKTSITVYLTSNAWTSTGIAGFRLWAPGGARTITGITSGPTANGTAPYLYSYTLTLSSYLTSGAGSVQVVKPASHPLDGFSRHESDERVTSGSGWNKGDTGVSSTANSATAATQITDTTKTWSGSEFNGLSITFPGLFDGNGKWVTATINGGGANTVTFTPAVNGLTTTGGDNYFIGTRHVSCADCHNPHASFRNPEGFITAADSTTITDGNLVQVSGWYKDLWVGRLIRVRSAANNLEQVRYITGFDWNSGTYTVSLPWGTQPAVNDSYEVLMGDVWTSAGQSGGRAGSGSSGVWGTVVTGGWSTGFTRGGGALVNAANLVFQKIENVFDNTGTLGGSASAAQRDLCVRCHSYYAYGTATPMTPSGTANGSAARSTDVAAEFNPQNVAHHAVYARGNNQPIKANYNNTNSAYNSWYNTNWPKYNTANAADTVTVSNGVATFQGTAALPRTTLPGWFIYIGADSVTGGTTAVAGTTSSGFLEITSITSPTSFTVRYQDASGNWVTNANIAGKAGWFVTAGLGNSFVPPGGPWSVLRCTDCHGSTKTDPVGPHASVNTWLIKDGDTALQFEWMNSTSGAPTYQTINYNDGTIWVNNTAEKRYFCYNCHRVDVYGSKSVASGAGTPVRNTQSRVSHGAMYVADGARLQWDSTNTGTQGDMRWPQFCRHCHGGDKLGGIHGSNAARVKGDNVPQSIRFLNGASWSNGVTVGTSGLCYTRSSADTTVSSCTNHPNGKTVNMAPTYNYTGY